MNTKGLFSGSTTIADNVDLYTIVITSICGAVAIGIFISIFYFSWKYHNSRGHEGEDFQSGKLEIFWSVITLVVFMGFFAWATYLYKKQVTPHEKTDYEVFVYAKRWMWKFYHPNGFAEVNELHLPNQKNIRLVLLSKDVIHSFFLPDFRLKQDALPEIYTYMFIRPEKKDHYQVYCAEYCGSYHSRMMAITKVMEEKDYLEFIGAGKTNNRGAELFKKHSCNTCHYKGSTIAPDLGQVTKKRDDNFIRRSILYPKEYVEKGYEPVMPSFKDQISENDLRFLIKYIRSMEVQ